ncbi:unnamed protein product, partial [Oppiella nova]
RIRHRGPDWSGCIIAGNHIFCHERLAIVGVDSGAQPITNADNSIILSVNGEIYNYLNLKKLLNDPQPYVTQSDCEIILHLYREIGDKVVDHLDGQFAFVLYDKKADRLIAARDPIGITTLYYGYDSRSPKSIYFASEMKSLNEDCDRILSFPPGHLYDSKTGQIRRWFDPNWWSEEVIASAPLDYTLLKRKLEHSVRKRLMSEVPYGVLLSGGLDSSLIASIAVRETRNVVRRKTSRPVLRTDSEDGNSNLLAARDVAKFLKTKHHEYIFTIQEGLDAISDVIYHLETYDVTTVRASTPMYLLSRKIKAIGVKMVLSGEGSDEIFGGYLYFHSAPSAEALHQETVKRVKNLHTSDCLRANKSTLAWGLEARVPFLDIKFLDVAMNVDPKDKMCSSEHIEKYILRKAFDTSHDPTLEPYLPDNILWRQKEQFSDGVGYSWIDSLRDEAERKISDEEFAKRDTRWPDDTPQTKEAFWYRQEFEKWFPEKACTESVVRWVPRTDWGCSPDPSGRSQKVHTQAYHK